ncbi:MAG TPA: hypothetical protein DCZ94_10025 [Lentisphaeria bacterium]|nr:MAG: hypothetical protein A2X48_08435 [Lentisphaerae bacterium GWF2_49_21]HBC87281.1 hypothetical protein [Lentisphaeria bacterium]
MNDPHKISMTNTFAMSYAYGPKDWKSTIGHIDQKIFQAVEIPGEFLDVKDIADEFKSAGLKIINVEEPLPLPVTGSIYGQDRNIIDKIKMQLSIMLRDISGFPCRNVSIDFGIDLAVSVKEKKDFLVDFIKEMTPVLEREKINLCIPARIPMHPPAVPEDYFSLLKETMYGGIRFSADIYPHEIAKAADYEDFLKWYRFDMNLARFIYEAEAGNLLVEKIMENWFAAFEKTAYRGPIIFCPKISSPDHYISESERLAELIKSFKTRKKPVKQPDEARC